MATVRLRGQQNNGTGEAPESQEVGGPIALRPIPIAGVVVTKASLVQSLRVYVPQLEDIEAFEDGEHSFLKLKPAATGER